MSNANDQKRQIVIACQRLFERGLVANHDGNISFRTQDGSLLATPTSFSKADITEEDILHLDQAGKVLQGRHKVFSEISWHLAIYRVRPDVDCIVHGHPPTASGFGLAGQEIGTPGLPEAIVSLGRHILTTGFLSPLDPSVNRAGGAFDLEFARALAESDAFIVPGNGVWAVGQNPLQTYLRLELVEQIAKQHLVAHQLGGVRRLSPELVNELLKKRPGYKGPVSQAMAPLPNNPSALPDLEQLKSVVRAELSQILGSRSP